MGLWLSLGSGLGERDALGLVLGLAEDFGLPEGLADTGLGLSEGRGLAVG
jgi:hypothetical protein